MDELTPQNLEQLPAFNACSARERLFLLNLAVDFNAARAAREVGYSESTAQKQAAGWIGKNRESSAKPHLYDAFQELLELRGRACWLRAEDVLSELAAIGFADIGQVASWDEYGRLCVKPSEQMTSVQRRVIQEISYTPGKHGAAQKVKLHDKLGALTLLGKHLGLFVERTEHSGPDGGPIQLAMQLSDDTRQALDELLGAGRE